MKRYTPLTEESRMKFLDGWDHIPKNELHAVEPGTWVRYIVDKSVENKRKVSKPKFFIVKGGYLMNNQYPKRFILKRNRNAWARPIDNKVTFFQKIGKTRFQSCTDRAHERMIYQALKSGKFVLVPKVWLTKFELVAPKTVARKYFQKILHHTKARNALNRKIKVYFYGTDDAKISKKLTKYKLVDPENYKSLSLGNTLYAKISKTAQTAQNAQTAQTAQSAQTAKTAQTLAPSAPYLLGPYTLETNAYPTAIVMRSDKNPDQVLTIEYNTDPKEMTFELYKKKRVRKKRGDEKGLHIAEIMKALEDGEVKLVNVDWIRHAESFFEN